MRKRSIVRTILLAAIAIAFFGSAAHARRIALYSWPKSISPGQLGIIYFENPEPETPITRTSCVADRLIAWVKSDVPILRIEQKGKQIWTSLGSYNSMGDTAFATFMAPVGLEPGPATIYIVNERDASIPHQFMISSTIDVKITGLAGAGIQPLKDFTLTGEGFYPSPLLDPAEAIRELDANVGYQKMPPAEQWTTLNRRVTPDWDRLPAGDFLYIKQGNKEWRTFVTTCGISKTGLSLMFSAPPDIAPGPATLTLVLRLEHKEVSRTPPFTVTVQ